MLVVDDNIVNQKILVGLLTKMGYTCDVAHTGMLAIDKYHLSRKHKGRNKYELIFMDMVMPVMGGIEATSIIRSLELTELECKKKSLQKKGKIISNEEEMERVRIVGLSGNVGEEFKTKALEVGMDYYLTKPYQKEQIEHVLNLFCKSTKEDYKKKNEVEAGSIGGVDNKCCKYYNVNNNNNDITVMIQTLKDEDEDVRALINEKYDFRAREIIIKNDDEEEEYEIVLSLPLTKQVTAHLASLLLKELKLVIEKVCNLIGTKAQFVQQSRDVRIRLSNDEQKKTIKQLLVEIGLYF